MVQEIILRMVGFFRKEFVGGFPETSGLCFVFYGIWKPNTRVCKIQKLLDILSGVNIRSVVNEQVLSEYGTRCPEGSVLYFSYVELDMGDLNCVTAALKSRLFDSHDGNVSVPKDEIKDTGVTLRLDGAVPSILSPYRILRNVSEGATQKGADV